MNRFRDMQFFCSVVEQGNFTRAAKAMNVTPAIVGRRITAFEQALGFNLFNRTTRQVNLTPAGQEYYLGAKNILREMTELEDSLKVDNQVNPIGTIQLSAPDGLGNKTLIQAISAFKKRYPKINFVLKIDNQPLDLIEHSIDLSFRLSFDLVDSSYIATKLMNTGFGLYASAGYLAERGIPQTIEQLEKHDCILMGANRYGGQWHMVKDDKTVAFKQDWSLVVSNTDSLINAIASHMGIGLVPNLFMSQDILEQHKITPITQIANFPTLGLYAMYPTKNHLPYRIRLFLDFIKDWFPEQFPTQREDQS